MSEGRKSAETFHPAEFIRDEMKARGWANKDLAIALDCRDEYAEHILAGKKITGRDAHQLARAFGTSVDVWVNLQAMYDEEEQ